MSDERSFEAALSLFQHRLYKTMGKAKLRAVALGGSATDIERAFYDALQKADLDKLMACWADEDEIVCVHPGGVRLVGALEIRKSFESIFSGGSMHVNVLSVKIVLSMVSVMSVVSVLSVVILLSVVSVMSLVSVTSVVDVFSVVSVVISLSVMNVVNVMRAVSVLSVACLLSLVSVLSVL